MKRDLTKLASKEYDLIIIGAGIYGAWAAWDATLRGLSVAIVDKGDFGGATSSNSLKIIHGGLRYLQHADFKRMRESIRERTTLMRVAPHLVHPLPCVMPTYGHGIKGREAMFCALALNDFVSLDRNFLDDPQKHLPGGSIFSKDKLLRILPGLDEEGLTGGALWYDCQIYNSERLLISLISGAVERGAEAANYARVESFLRDENRILGVRISDQTDGRSFKIRGKMVLNCSGPWINETLGLLKNNISAEEFRLSKAMNLVVKRKLVRKFAAGVPSKRTFVDSDAVLSTGSRMLFLAPWRQYTLIGTTHLIYDGEPENFRISEKDVVEFLDEFNQAWPAMRVKREEIGFFYGGLLPADEGLDATGQAKITKHYKLVDHAEDFHLGGLISVLGVKFTTARDVAEKAIDLAFRKLGKKNLPSATRTKPIPGGSILHLDDYILGEIEKRPWGLEANQVRRLIYNYGRNYEAVLNMLDENSDWRAVVDSQEKTLWTEVAYAVRNEMAVTLSDAVRRRTELGSAVCPADETFEKVSRFMANQLDWNESKRREEVEAAKAIYTPDKTAEKVPDSESIID